MSAKINFLDLLPEKHKSVQVYPGETLFQKGDRAVAVYVVKSGKLEIFDGDGVYETVGPGDLLGEMALIDKAPRSASVRAVSECAVAPIDAQKFITMIESHTGFGIAVMRVLVRRLRAMDERAIRKRSGRDRRQRDRRAKQSPA
jgi:CRP-like cAMP-binding protein